MAVKYFIDSDKRTCVCLISVKKKLPNGKFHVYQFKGKAKCNPSDTFNETIGADLAHVRALLKFKNWEKVLHTDTIEFCKKAADYYNKQTDKFNQYLDKTDKAIERLNQELKDMLEETE